MEHIKKDGLGLAGAALIGYAAANYMDENSAGAPHATSTYITGGIGIALVVLNFFNKKAA